MNSSDISFNRRELLHVIAGSSALGTYRQDNDPTEITECTTIDESGEYTLGSDIDGTGDCLRIDTAEVVLDGNGHIVQGDESGTGIECGEAGPVIRNLTVRGFETGIRGALLGPRLENITVEDNTGDGIEFDDGYISCSGCTLQRNGGAGFSTGWDSEAELTNCDVRENDGQAIVGGADAFLLDNCVVADNGGPVAVPPSPGEQKIVDTEIRNSASAGLKIIGSDVAWLGNALTVQNCTIRDNEGPGIEHESSFLEVRDCTISGNRDGYRGSYSQQWRAVLRDNEIEGNGEYGVAFAEWFRDDADPIDARENYWGAQTGPSSKGEPLEDPETATLADGDGDAIAEGPEAGVACARFDPYSQPVDEDPIPFFEVNITNVPETVKRGETITVDATVKNTGGAGTTAVSLFIDEKQESVDSKEVELNEGAQTEVSLEYETKSGDPPSVEAIVSPADEGLEDTETITVEERAEPQFEMTAQSTTNTVAPGETTRISVALSNTGDAAGAVSVFFQAASDATEHNADYFGDDFTVVAHDDDGGDWAYEGWSWTEIGPDNNRNPSVELEVSESLNPGGYTFAVTARSNDRSPDDSATPTVTVEESTVAVQPTDLRLVQTAEHTRREQYRDIVSRSALEAEGALPAWAPDTELVARKETVPLFDLKLSQTDVDQSLETAIDVSISWGQSGPDDQSFTLRPEFVSSVLGDTTAVSSVLEAFVDGRPRPGVDGETYPVVELPTDMSDVSITVSPQDDDITGNTASLTDVSTIETGSLNIGMVLLSDTEDATEYAEVAVDEFEQRATRQRETIQRLFPVPTVNITILTEPVAIKASRLRELLPAWDYRERHQRLAWEYAREELEMAMDAVVAFAPRNFLADNSEGGQKGLITLGECEQAVLVDMGLSDTTTAAHELTHYFLGAYTAGTEYEATDDTGDSDGFHLASDIVSTTIEFNETNEIPLDKNTPEFNNYSTSKSYMQRSSLSTAGPDTITAQTLLDDASDSGFTCAWGAPEETSGTVVSVSASVTADGIDIHSTVQSNVLSPSTAPSGNAEATIQDANGDTVDSFSLETTTPETIATEGGGNCCKSTAAQDETVIRGRLPFPEEAASITLTAANPDNPDADVSTSVNPVTETFREEIAALSDAQFDTGVNPETTRQSYLDRLDNATVALDSADYEAAENNFETLRGDIQTEVRSDYEPPAGIPSQQDLLDGIDDRLDRIDRLQEDAEGSPDEPAVADYTNKNGIVDTQGVQTAIDDLRTGDIRIALLRDVMTAWRTGNPVD